MKHKVWTRNKLIAGTFLTLAGGAWVAEAAAPNIIAAVNARKANYKEIGGAFKTINDEIKTGSPDLNTIRPLAKDIFTRASGQLKYFPQGSGPQVGVKTRAKAAIWSDQAGFKQAHGDMVAAASALQDAASRGDIAALTAARTKLGATCKTCHDKYREAE
jgi:cytochrome c556